MRKKCPECGTILPLEGGASCPKCGLLLGHLATEAGRISQEQEERIIDGVSNRLGQNKPFLWKISWRTLTWFISLLGFVFGWGILSAVRNLHDLARKRFDALDHNMSNLVAEANVRIGSNIARQFEEPRIRATVENVAGKERKAI